MINQQEIAEEIKSLSSLRNIIETYQEIAATRMQRVKDSVLRNRDFLADLHDIYSELRTSYVRELDRIIKRKNRSLLANSTDFSLLTRNNKSVSVLLSSNTKLYGDIIKKTFNRFKEEINTNESDIVIVGKVGLQMFKEAAIDRPYTFFELSDSILDDKAFNEVIEQIKPYEKITVYHGKFEDILSQIASTTEISTNLPTGEPSSKDNEETKPANVRRSYIFEPSLEEVLIFFETEILASILEQTVNESNLSKFTSRMISLDSTVENINKNLKQANFTKQWLRHRELNRKQLDSLSGLTLWNS
ncbi:F0F1 ATP synthase subunit gamma [candidate division WWE3 bacterium]|uniref:F0F1 ATP synthase subunit gamma n=1 Tax=candidate division WWE3 bacterium TaxID=2053526 RepID=A0A955RPW5_UNCKA|nr:F0F1 ATP synthase subunit gamma [candidate division WWE3 bacterium]